MAELADGFLCQTCGRTHQVLPLSFSVKYPQALAGVAPEDVDRRVVMTRDQCVLDGARFFLRGRIVLPVHGVAEPFIWGVWAELSPKNFLRAQQRWTTQGREHEPSYPGWLDTDLPLYGTTLNLQVDVQTQVVGRRPHFQVALPGHPLGREQRAGISRARVGRDCLPLLHGGVTRPTTGRIVASSGLPCR